MNRYPWLEEFGASLPGAVQDFKAKWDATRFLVADKMFAMIGTDKDGLPIITVKLEPSHGEAARAAYDDVVPGYYMNKVHWNSVSLQGSVPDEVLRAMIIESHSLIVSSLTKKARADLGL